MSTFHQLFSGLELNLGSKKRTKNKNSVFSTLLIFAKQRLTFFLSYLQDFSRYMIPLLKENDFVWATSKDNISIVNYVINIDIHANIYHVIFTQYIFFRSSYSLTSCRKELNSRNYLKHHQRLALDFSF